MRNAKKIYIFFPKDSEALFNKKSTRTFGGASVQLYNIAKELNKYCNVQTISIIPNYKGIDFDDMNYFNLARVYNENDHIIIKFFKFIKYIKIGKPDVIIQRGLTNQSCVLALLCRLFKIKFIFMFAHDVEVQGLRQSNQKKVIMLPLLLRFAYQLITQNQYQKDTLKNKYNIDSIIIYNGFEIGKKPKNKKEYVLWVARCDKWKQPEIFIELAKKNPTLKFLMICPKSNDERYFESVKQAALNIPNLHFFDFVPYKEIDIFFSKAFLFINTSLYEGFPQTFIQATMNGVPVISLNVNPENFLDIYNCGFCCQGNVEVLNKKIKELSKDSNKYKKISDNAYKYAYNNHNISVNIKKILHIFPN